MKKKEKVESVEEPIIAEPQTKASKIDLLELDLGRGDLNILRDKINEVISKLNGN